MPGRWLVTAAVVLSGALCWVWLMSGGAGSSVPENGSHIAVSELARVDDRDVAAALKTMDGSAAFLAEFGKDTSGCRLPLAWVALTGEAGQSSRKVRLRSGPYLSPEFTLSDTPVRVAIPFPNRYETGHGSLEALHAGGGMAISLVPAWHVQAPDGAARHEVSWHPGQSCGQPNG